MVAKPHMLPSLRYFDISNNKLGLAGKEALMRGQDALNAVKREKFEFICDV